MHDAFVVQVTEGAADLTGEVRHLAHGVDLKGDDLLTPRHVGFEMKRCLMVRGQYSMTITHLRSLPCLSLAAP